MNIRDKILRASWRFIGLGAIVALLSIVSHVNINVRDTQAIAIDGSSTVYPIA